MEADRPRTELGPSAETRRLSNGGGGGREGGEVGGLGKSGGQAGR